MNDLTDLTPILEAIIVLCVALVTTFLIPYIKGKTTKEQQDKIEYWVKVAVNAAEQIYVGSGRGKVKKAYVLQFLKNKGFTFDMDAIDKLIESAVYGLGDGNG